MKLSGLLIQNFKAIGRHRFELSGLNVFLGKNSVGKSSTIQSLLLLRATIPPPELIAAVTSEEEPIFRGEMDLQTDYIDLGYSNEVFKIDEIDERFLFRLESRQGEIELLSLFESGKDSLPYELKASGDYRFDFLGSAFQYLSADRIAPNDLFSLSIKEVERAFQLGNSGKNTAHFLLRFGNEPAFYVTPELLHTDKSIPPNLLNQVSAYISDLGTDLRVQVSQIADRVQLKYDVFRSNGLTDTFKPQNVGFGLTYSLPVITSLLAGKPGKVQIIENPESHLHPMGQAQMGRLLAKAAKAGQQLFIETHSDHIVNGIRVAIREGLLDPNEAILHFFDKPKGQKEISITPIRIDKYGNLSDYPDGFLDEWDNQLLKLL